MRTNARFVSLGLLVLAAFAIGGWSNPTLSAQGLYVRGAGGFSSPRDAKFTDDSQTDCFLITGGVNNCTGRLDDLDTGGVAEIGLGINLASLPGARAEITYGWHGRYSLSGTDPAGTSFNARVRSQTVMLNFFYEFASMNIGSVRPFAGVGIGVASNRLNNINWSDPPTSGVIPGGKNTDLAWQFTLGLAMAVQRNFVLEFMYRYMDMGEFNKDRGRDVSGAQFNPTNVTGSATGKLRANEFLFGVRYLFD